ncbi:MAG: dehydrogenase [Frankiales bacterium]|nr:dehydrogenase [Frankiales bacterium]
MKPLAHGKGHHMTRHQGARHRVVIIGSGFGGLFAAKKLKRADVDVTLIARTGHHLFQPLLYQVATGILSPGEIAPATREILRRQENARVLLGDVTEVDLARRTVTSLAIDSSHVTEYDTLIVAAGAGQSYFGNDHFSEFAPGLKSIDDALELRGRIFGAYEMAELESDPAALDAWLTFVVVGAGPTGVEMAGQIAELARRTLGRDFRSIDPKTSRVILLDAADAVLGQFGQKLSQRAEAKLNDIGVEVQLGAKVVGVDATGIDVEDAGGARRRIPSRTKVWAAGVSAAPIGKQIAEQAGVQVDRAGRVPVNRDLTLPGHPEVFVVGDMMSLDRLPGVAQVAMQGAQHAAGQIRRRLAGKASGQPFRYVDKGSMATVSRFNAVAAVGPLRLSGFLAWLMWLVIHIVYLIGFKNRLTTLLHWAVSFLGRGRSERTVTLQQVVARNVLKREGTYALGMPRAAALGSATESGDAPASIGDGERLPA